MGIGTDIALQAGARGSLAVAAMALAFLAVAASPQASVTPPESSARVAQARVIRADLDARSRLAPRPAFGVRKSTTMDAIESLALLSGDLLERRVVPAETGIWFELCPLGGICPSPAARLARPAADVLPRRVALELALRTFLETDAHVVAVSLPTPRTVAFVVTRDELAREVEHPAAVLTALRAESLRATSAELRRTVDALTRGHTYVFLGFEPGAHGGLAWGGMPRWPRLDP